MISLFLSFLLGALTIIVVEALVFLHVLNRLSSKNRIGPAESHVGCDLDAEQSLSFSHNKQGFVWILESERAPKVCAEDNAPRDQKSKKEILEVYPVKKHAKIKDRLLILTDPNGSQETIQLVGCMIRAVSASNLPSRKWAKRYPIKVESKSAVIYSGSRICYIYLETSWEKESWCKSLCLAASADNERLTWYAKLSGEFHDYITSLIEGHFSFMKPSTGFSNEHADRTSRIEGSSSKVRVLLKKITRKASKGGLENKTSGTSLSGREERKIGEKSHAVQYPFLASGLRASLTEKTTTNSLEEYREQSLHSENSGSQSQFSVISEADSDDKSGIDEGTLCWNLLISRLFFDAKRNVEVKSSIQARVQRTLDNLRTPSYISGVTCSGLDLGNLPPFIRSMRILPMDMNEVWTMEIDIEYSGGAILDVETRLEVREPAFQKSIGNSSLDSNSVGESTSHLEDFEYLGDQLKLSGEIVDEIEKRDDGNNGLKNSKGTSWTSTYVSRWKSILNSVANQVSQVPLSLAIKVASVRGTLRLHFKPPPSDQLWFGFTSMPDVDFNLASAVGDHKITSGQIALLLGNRFKVAIRETLVLPNCESICIPWMLAEKDDWVPRKIAPFIWLRHEAASEPTVREAPGNPSGDTSGELVASGRGRKQNTCSTQDEHEKSKNVIPVHQTIYESSSESASSQTEIFPSSSSNQSTCSRSLQELSTPLLRNEPQESCIQRGAVIGNEEHRKIGKRERMMGLGKKMGEMIEEKRRHIEEKSRHIVEKMRAPS
ncbi:testis-expressed protein 2-like isoform X2 [Telopea speciosissima]|uniref:testis-expressed protein 2-like isoform X2 n=1 Tax=Telopea speciosissima TaxID=54955 RepID=UPI001CC5AA42|nr:testis-expressed protein 2-like isoform X2 [Telopea speciosissima]